MVRRFGNQYTNLIKKWEFTRPKPSAPFIGRRHRDELINVYYVSDGYVEEDTPTRYDAIETRVITPPYYN